MEGNKSKMKWGFLLTDHNVFLNKTELNEHQLFKRCRLIWIISYYMQHTYHRWFCVYVYMRAMPIESDLTTNSWSLYATWIAVWWIWAFFSFFSHYDNFMLSVHSENFSIHEIFFLFFRLVLWERNVFDSEGLSLICEAMSFTLRSVGRSSSTWRNSISSAIVTYILKEYYSY